MTAVERDAWYLDTEKRTPGASIIRIFLLTYAPWHVDA